jgi:hypothetical protein
MYSLSASVSGGCNASDVFVSDCVLMFRWKWKEKGVRTEGRTSAESACVPSGGREAYRRLLSKASQDS